MVLIPLEKPAIEYDITFIHTEDGAYFENDDLAKFCPVMFLSLTGEILKMNSNHSFQPFIQNDGGFTGIHSTTPLASHAICNQ